MVARGGLGPGGAKLAAVCYDGDAMRCPNCAGEVPAGSRFCGICGRNITAVPPPLAHAIASDAQAEPRPAMSLFELPAQRRARATRMALVLALDAILAAAGVVMILSYLEARRVPEPEKKPTPPKGAAVQVGAPKPVAPSDAPPTPAQPETKKKTQDAGGRAPATASRQPAVPAAPVVTPIAEPAEESEPADDIDEVSARLTELVRRHEGDLERCYQRVAKVSGPSDPLEGRIDVHVTVMPDGSAQGVHAGENTTGSAPLADCLVTLFKSWSLAAGAADPVELVWPLQFRSPSK
jgi:hypothetical protein